jgi:hypothetical protein
MTRGLLNLLTALSQILALAVVALWVRSRLRVDTVTRQSRAASGCS